MVDNLIAMESMESYTAGYLATWLTQRSQGVVIDGHESEYMQG